MKHMTSRELRKAFRDFFLAREHLLIASAPLVPNDDPTLLWINAGMAPLKAFFDGRKIPPHTRLLSIQKCLRTNDIENVGRTARHHTFFEMMGNFSLNDYFKREAILWAWEFVVEVLGIGEENLWVSVFKEGDQEDKEAAQIWLEEVGLDPERLVYLGREDNFWEIGEGPCGPSSEIHFDRGQEHSCGPNCRLGCDCDRFLEIWNLVFTQFTKKADGSYEPLATKNIDTGMGLERVLAILQGGQTNYETDLFQPYLDYLEKKAPSSYKDSTGQIKMAYRVIADHIRALVFTLADGGLPSNEGRGYVVRRILRKASLYGQHLNFKGPFLYQMVDLVLENMGQDYPEIVSQEDKIKQIILLEEERFQETLNLGLEILKKEIIDLKAKKEDSLSGLKAFQLYDTYGFPLDLTKDILEEDGIFVDEEGFSQALEEQRTRARQDWASRDAKRSLEKERYLGELTQKIQPSIFSGYNEFTLTSQLVALLNEKGPQESLSVGEEGTAILKETPFYPEGGGQVGDRGIWENEEGLKLEVLDTYNYNGLILHDVRVKEGILRLGQEVMARVDKERRLAIMRNHTATHLLHKALREILGDHVEQAGSLVEENRLRFDFKHNQALTKKELEALEKSVNLQIMENYPTMALETSIEEAKNLGALAIFTEKYGEEVRVISIGDYSRELCGGTHVDFTGQLSTFKIVSEGGIASGVRRIEALTGLAALDYYQQQEELIYNISQKLKANPYELEQKIETILHEQEEINKKLREVSKHSLVDLAKELSEKVELINGVAVLRSVVNVNGAEELRQLGDLLKEKLKSSLIVLATKKDDKGLLLTMVSPDLIKERGLHAGKLIGSIAKIIGGGGGGRPDMAQAGGPNWQDVAKALSSIVNLIEKNNS